MTMTAIRPPTMHPLVAEERARIAPTLMATPIIGRAVLLDGLIHDLRMTHRMAKEKHWTAEMILKQVHILCLFAEDRESETRMAEAVGG